MHIFLQGASLRALNSVILGIAYRLRGGGFIQFGNDTAARLVWAAAMLLAIALEHLANFPWPRDFSIYCALFPVLAFAAVTLPHAAFQAMGRYPSPQKPTWMFWLPTIAQTTWTAWPTWKRTAYDCAGMASIAALSGLIVFAPGYFVFGWEVFAGVAKLAIGMPLAYLLGYCVRLTLPSLQARSTEWGELFTGIAWGVALW